MHSKNKIDASLMRLLKIQSFSGNETKIADYIASRLPGFTVKKQFVDGKRYNIIARKGKSKIWLLAHMDTVKSWVEPRETKGRIYGRGAVDNKGNIALALEVGKRIKDLNICFTVGEEDNFIGAIFAKKVIKNDPVVVMEPTNFEIYSSQRGVVVFEAAYKGTQGHSGYLDTNLSNALHALIKDVDFLMRKGWTAFNIGKIEGGIAANITAPEAKVVLSVRPENLEEYSQILKEIKRKYKIIKQIPPYANEKISGKTKRGFTEMCFFKNSILWGVGRVEQAHSANEYIKKAELTRAPEKLVDLIDKVKSSL